MPDFSIEDQYEGIICGIDEVGRGPLAGPVVAAAVIIPVDKRACKFVKHLNDSKKISFKKREALYKEITEHCPHAIAEITPKEIDEINILQASLKAMKTAHDILDDIEVALVDGNKAPALSSHVVTVVKGDSKSNSIAAASILAKVYRDRIMRNLHEEYPQYGWNTNAGYPTKVHRAALLTHGVTSHHRKSFAPIRSIIESNQ